MVTQGVYQTWKPGKTWKTQGIRFDLEKLRENSGNLKNFQNSGNFQILHLENGKNLEF
jgi:hypothetical protein